MIPPGDRSIRNIPIPSGHHHIHKQDIPEYYQPETPQKRRHKRRVGRFIAWSLGIILLCIVGVGGVSMFYAGATVVAHPRTESTEASATLIAQTTAPVGVLAFSRLSSTAAATTTVPATGTKKVSRQAKGTVLISSTYTTSQRLIANTRLEAGDGKIYRLASSVDLPANGSVTAAIQAESPGESYNRSGTTSFTLPGFKGDPRFEKFSAKSQGAITGGFVGDEPAVAQSDLEAAKAELVAELDSTTQRQLAQSIPNTSVAIPGSLAMEYGEIIQTPSADKKSATLSQSATATGAVVNIRDLASALAAKVVDDYNGEAIDFKDLGGLTLAASSTSEGGDQMTIRVSGETTLVWQFDPGKLKEAMLGKSKAEFQNIVESFAPAIKSATATIRPFWIANFPSDPAKIKIETEVE